MQKQYPLLAHAKLSNYHIKRIIFLYAHNVAASKAAQEIRVSYPTIRTIYQLIRQRMLELRVYRRIDDVFREMDEMEEEGYGYYSERPLLDFLKRELKARPGVTAETRAAHEAEIIYRFEFAPVHGDRLGDYHYREILYLVRITGSLNRPVDPDWFRKVFEYRIGMTMAGKLPRLTLDNGSSPSDDP